MVLNLDRCIGCWACAVACKMENSIGEGLWWQEIKTIGGADIDTSAGVFPNVSKHYQPRNCFHCAEPPCLPVCPTSAIVQRADGIVDIIYDKCIGCGKCEPACPYDAIEMNQFAPVLPTGLEQGHGAAEVPPRRAHVVEKCTFCSHRVTIRTAPWRASAPNRVRSASTSNPAPILRCGFCRRWQAQSSDAADERAAARSSAPGAGYHDLHERLLERPRSPAVGRRLMPNSSNNNYFCALLKKTSIRFHFRVFPIITAVSIISMTNGNLD